MLQIIGPKLRYLGIGLLFSCLLLTMGCDFRVNPQDNQGNIGSANPADYPELDQYGDWINVPPYGEVWQPYVWDTDNWRPFYNGHWIWSNYGWAWVSYEPFGWLVYHYGDWDFQAGIGWFWIPGDEWSPARVHWIGYGDYIGWAPIPPPGVTWPDPWVTGAFMPWNVVDANNFTSDDIGHHRFEHPPRWEESRPFERRAPQVHEMEQRSRKPVTRSHIDRETVKSAKRHFQRMRLPEPEERRIQPYREHVQKEVLRPKRVETSGRGETERKPAQPQKQTKENQQQQQKNDKQHKEH